VRERWYGALLETFGQVRWLGQETGHNAGRSLTRTGRDRIDSADVI